MNINWYQARQFPGFYAAAETQYQLHSPYLFEFARAVLEDRRWYYAFSDIERIRREMLRSGAELTVADYGAVGLGEQPLYRRTSIRRMARFSGSSPDQGRFLFRLVQWLKPKRMLELGTSVGIGSMYLAASALAAQLYTLEGSPECAQVAGMNLGILGLQKNTNILTGPFSDTLKQALQALEQIDLVFFDGHHQGAATLTYFENCLPYVHPNSLLVFDDIYWSADMNAAWKKIQEHTKVTATVDCFDLGLVFLNPDFKVKQHFKLVPTRLKPWKTAHLK